MECTIVGKIESLASTLDRLSGGLEVRISSGQLLGPLFQFPLYDERVKLLFPQLDLAGVASGRPRLKAMLANLCLLPENLTASGWIIHVYLEAGMDVFFAKKLTTLVLLLEEALLMRLVFVDPAKGFELSPLREVLAKSLESHQLLNPGPDFDQCLPSVKDMKPSLWNNEDPEHGYNMLQTVWTCETLQGLQSIMMHRRVFHYGFNISGQDLLWSTSDISSTSRHSLARQIKLSFEHFQGTFDHDRCHNWTEVVARVAELALAGPDEFKKCVETILSILHEADQGAETWERLMEHVLKLEHRIPDWRDQLAAYEDEEVMADLADNKPFRKQKKAHQHS
ncbi:hypothetical protein ACHAPT_009300 [Fusarium lateritium]